METTTEALVGCLSMVLQAEVNTDSDGENYVFSSSRFDIEPLPAEKVERLVAELKEATISDETTLIAGQSAEYLVQLGGTAHWSLGRDTFTLRDDQLGLTYSIGFPSDRFSVFLALEAQRRYSNRVLVRSAMDGMRLLRLRDEPVQPLPALGRLFRARTLKIESVQEHSPTGWRSLAEGFLYQMGYNLDLAIMPERSLDQLVRAGRIRSTRRSSRVEMDVPRRKYDADLVHHYQLGVAADNPMLQYLSFYHVAEHWFEDVYRDDLIARLQGLITGPGFSYRRKSDIGEVVKMVSKAMKVRDERQVINEGEALRLTLLRYVDLARLEADLAAYDSDLIDHYRHGQIGFSGGDEVDLSGSDKGVVAASLSKRIYKTRNALVHSKQGTKARYIPFRHDGELEKEVPLIRFASEQIIESTSSML